MATFMEELLAQGGGNPLAFRGTSGAFPAAPAPALTGEALWAEIEAQQAAEREAADRRNATAMIRKPIAPFNFGAPDAQAPGIQYALGNLPPVAMGSPIPFGLGAPPSDAGPAVADAGGPGPMPGAGSAPFLPVPMGPGSTPRAAPVVAATSDDEDEAAIPPKAAPTRGVPMSLIPPAAQAQQIEAAAPSGFERVASALKGAAPALLGAGGALQGDGGAMTRSLLKDERDLALTTMQQNATARALLSRGAQPEEVLAAVRNPELLKAMVTKYFETKPAQVVNGRLVRERADGRVDLLADYSADEKKKNPVVRDFTNPDGSTVAKQWNATTGEWELIPGHEKPGPKDKDRRLSVSDITKLSEEGGKLQQIQSFQQNFKPEFGGWKSNSIGDLVNLAGRNLPEAVAGKNAAASAEWWQNYDRYKNMVRHELFGSALTKGESEAFMKADIGPGMTPEQIQKNLATQRRVVESAIRRKGKGLIGSTYDKNAIASAYGVSPDFFDQDERPALPSGKTGNGVPWSVVP